MAESGGHAQLRLEARRAHGSRLLTRIPATPGIVPQRWHGVGCLVGRAVLRALRFTIDGDVPAVPRCVAIAAPHTSNWDFVVGAAAMLALRLHIRWLGKQSLFRWPFGALMRFLGGIPVDRGAAQGVVEDALGALRDAERMWLAIAPEGTRRHVERWKSGFHRIAAGAGVPIWPVAFDYSRRSVTLFPLFQPTGDLEADLQALRALYRPEMARRQEGF
jgi:1-acyl-sn-glycerol-3-phosphate acyltransferase